MAFTPIDLYDELAGDVGGLNKEVTNHKCQGQFNKNRLFRYGGALYSIIFDDKGDTDPAHYLEPDYQRELWHAVKSTDDGATWTELDAANYPIGGLAVHVATLGDAVCQVGSVLWLFFTYSEEHAPGFTTKTSWTYAVPFDMATATWGTIVTVGGPSVGPFSVFSTQPPLVHDCCYRGGDEVVVYHWETDATRIAAGADTGRAMYSIFNTASQTWSSVGTTVFELTVAGSAYPGSCVFDGTYVHFTAIAGKYFSTTNWVKPHRTLDPSNILGAVSDMLVGYDAGWRPKNTSVGFLDNLIVFGGEVLCCENYTGYSSFGAPFFHQKVLVMRCPAGVQDPTWSAEDIESTAWEAGYDLDAKSGTPLFVESGGDLYCIAPGDMLGFFGLNPDEEKFWLYSQKYLGSGAWGAPVVFWDFRVSLGYVGSGGAIGVDELYDLAAIGNLTGDGIAAIGVTASFDNTPAEAFNNTVYWFRSDQSTCCCYDYAE